MRKVIVYIAMSLDGYVADKNCGVEFLEGDGSGENEIAGFSEFFDGIGDVVMGYKTYHQVVTELAPNNYPYEGKKSYVFTSKNLESTSDIIFTNETIESLISKLKANGETGNIWINGGASIVNQVIDSNLADEIIISIIPTILGDGINLFQKFDIEKKLKLKSTSSNNGIVEISYTMR